MTKNDTVEVIQAVDADADRLAVSLRMTNRSSAPVLVEHVDWLEATPLRQEFEITSEGQDIPYVGIMVKRAPYTREDFVALQPGQELVRRTRIDQAYEFLQGEHEYEIVHWHLGYEEKSGDVTSHSSPAVKFRFRK